MAATRADTGPLPVRFEVHRVVAVATDDVRIDRRASFQCLGSFQHAQPGQVLAAFRPSHLADGIDTGVAYARAAGVVVVEHVGPDLLQLRGAALVRGGLQEHSRSPAIGVQSVLLESAVMSQHDVSARQIQREIRTSVSHPRLSKLQIFPQQCPPECFPLALAQLGIWKARTFVILRSGMALRVGIGHASRQTVITYHT